jgi:light-regulated signal transduction histidine kinase (bacteriophytochrome)
VGVALLPDTDGQCVCFVLDISKRKSAEKALAQYAAELERSNEELERFASVASHDLREPLTKITGFSELLAECYGSSLGQDGRDYIRYIQDAGSRMSNLIESLLKLARVTTTGQPFEPVHLGAVLSEVVSDLNERVRKSGGRIEIGSLPRILADRMQMYELFQNLLANAVKYRKENEAPVVRIESHRVEGGFWEITVSDKGIGFSQESADRIFRPFERLHGRGFEGHGIGLAICLKIVQRHGGEITARSEPGRGSTFIVRLPATGGQ